MYRSRYQIQKEKHVTKDMIPAELQEEENLSTAQEMIEDKEEGMIISIKKKIIMHMRKTAVTGHLVKEIHIFGRIIDAHDSKRATEIKISTAVIK